MSWTRVGSLCKSKAGSLYIKVSESVTLEKDSALQLQDPRKKLEASVAAGRITEDKAAEIMAKIPDFVKYEVYLVKDNKK